MEKIKTPENLKYKINQKRNNNESKFYISKSKYN